MRSSELVYTVGIVGEKEGRPSEFTYVLAKALGKVGQVASGDYLDVKKLAGRSDIFHIGCYIEELVIDIINCPLNLVNFSLTSAQCKHLIWVLDPQSRSDTLRCAISIAAALNIQDHIVILNLSTLDQQLRQDEEILDLLELEVSTLFSKHDLYPQHIVKLTLEQFKLADGADAELSTIVHALIKDLRQDNLEHIPFVMQVERCYSVKGPGNNMARIAFGPVYSGQKEVGSTVSLVGFEKDSVDARIAEIEQFGDSRPVALAGGSVSLRFHSLQKELPKPGQVITDAPTLVKCAEELTLSVETVGPAVQVLAGLRGIELCVGMVVITGAIVDYKLDPSSSFSAIVSIKVPKLVPYTENQIFVLGNSGRILAWGKIERS